jgi:raffinose/stachyose/melibiose transport system permease protein
MLSRLPGRISRWAFLTIVGAACLGPTAWAVLSSFKTQSQIFGNGDFLPKPFTLQGYKALFTQIDITGYLGNSLLYAVGGTLGALSTAFLAAYPAARLPFPFRRSITVLFTAALAIPIASLIVPEFVIMRDLGLFDTRGGLVVFYSAMWFPLSFVILRNQLSGLPLSLEEAARIDGAGYFQILFRVILPLARSGLATAGVVVFINIWNDFLFNLLLAPSVKVQNVQLALSLFRGQFTVDISAILAGTTVMLIIPVVTFIALQRHVIAGLTAGTSR